MMWSGSEHLSLLCVLTSRACRVPTCTDCEAASQHDTQLHDHQVMRNANDLGLEDLASLDQLPEVQYPEREYGVLRQANAARPLVHGAPQRTDFGYGQMRGGKSVSCSQPPTILCHVRNFEFLSTSNSGDTQSQQLMGRNVRVF